MTVFAIGDWKTNAEMIRYGVVALGYLTKDSRTLDPTWGYGKWWTLWQPDVLIGSDIDAAKSPCGQSVDFRHLPHADASFDVVAYDPPFKLNGTGSDKDERYGVHIAQTRMQRMQGILDGMTECTRVLKPGGYLLVKVQDMVNGGKVHWQSDTCTNHGQSIGLTKVDALLFKSYRPQPPGRRQLTARRNYSTLMIFQKDA